MPARTLPLLVLLVAANAAAAQVVPPPAPPPPPPTPGPAAVPPPPKYPTDVGGKTLAEWLKDLKESPDPSVRDSAVRAIPLFGPDARQPALKPLMLALNREPDPGVKMAVVVTLGVIGYSTPEEARDISTALEIALGRASPGAITRLHIVRGLSNYGTAAHTALPAILGIITDPSWETRRAAAYAIGRVGFPRDPKVGPGAKTLSSLANTLMKDDSAAVRLEAVQSLILLGAPAYKEPAEYPVLVKPYLDAVQARQKVEKDKGVQIWLTMLAMRYDGGQLTDANIRTIADHMAGSDVSARLHALSAMSMLGDRAKPFIMAIATVLGYENDPTSVAAAVSALGTLGETAKAAIPDLDKVAKTNKFPEIQAMAAAAIEAASGKKKPPAAPPPKM